MKQSGSDFLNANRKPLRAHENICVFYKKQPNYIPQKTQGKQYKAKRGNTTSRNWGNYNASNHTENKDGKRYPLTVLNFPTQNNRNKLHPTQKPIDLLEYLIKTYTNENNLVLDNCMGSGSTTGIACQNTNRQFIGIEKDKQYYNIAVNRLLQNVTNSCNLL